MRTRWLVLALLTGCGSEDPSVGGTDTDASSGSTSGETIDPSTSSGDPTTTSTTESSSTTDASTSGTGTDTDATTGGPAVDPCDSLVEFADELPMADEADRLAQTQAWLRQKAYGEYGLPLRCTDGLGFVFLDDADGAISVAGDFNEWDPSATPLMQAVEGFGFRYAIVEVDEPATGGMYKIVRDETEFFADPWARRFGWDEFGEFSLTAARAGEDHHERWPDFDEGVGDLDPRNVVVWVPPDAEQAGQLPVLYMHDGQNLFDPDAFFGGWQASTTARAALDSADVPPLLIVAIDNTSARFDEYSHTTDDLGGGLVGGLGEDYTAFIVDGVKPFVDDRYPTRVGSESTGVLGSSMGGLISLYMGWLRPDVFGFVGSMSGTLGWGQFAADNDRVIELYDTSPPTGAVIYLDSGGSGPCPVQGTDNYCENIEMRDTLIDHGWTEGADLFYVWGPDAPHNEAAWAARFGDALTTWYPG